MEFPRIKQMSDSHCGVAALEILLAFHQVRVDQQKITELAGVRREIYRRGVRIDELQSVVKQLKNGLKLEVVEGGSMERLESLTQSNNWIGVEWQGLFRDKDDAKAQRAAFLGYSGHYGVVKEVNLGKDVLVMTDPYKTFFEKDRIFKASWFEKRWWDWNLVERGEKRRWVKQKRTMFIVNKVG